MLDSPSGVEVAVIKYQFTKFIGQFSHLAYVGLRPCTKNFNHLSGCITKHSV